MIKTICYISTIRPATSKKDIERLSKIIAYKNKRLNITGILIIKNGHFFQIMEGSVPNITAAYKKIKKDKRHTGLIKLLETPIEIRLFDAYDTGEFSVIKNYTKLKKLSTYFEWIKKSGLVTVDKLIILTNNFLKHSK